MEVGNQVVIQLCWLKRTLAFCVGGKEFPFKYFCHDFKTWTSLGQRKVIAREQRKLLIIENRSLKSASTKYKMTWGPVSWAASLSWCVYARLPSCCASVVMRKNMLSSLLSFFPNSSFILDIVSHVGLWSCLQTTIVRNVASWSALYMTRSELNSLHMKASHCWLICRVFLLNHYPEKSLHVI